MITDKDVKDLEDYLKRGFLAVSRDWYIVAYPDKKVLKIENKTGRKAKYKITAIRDDYYIAVEYPEKNILAKVKANDRKFIGKIIQAILERQFIYDIQQKRKSKKSLEDPLLDTRKYHKKDAYPWHHIRSKVLKSIYKYMEEKQIMNNLLIKILHKKGKSILAKKVAKVLIHSWKLGDYSQSLGNTIYLLSETLEKLIKGQDMFSITVDEDKIDNKGTIYFTLGDWDGNDHGTLKAELDIGGDKHYPIYKFDDIKTIVKFKNKNIENILKKILKNTKEELDADYSGDDQIEEVTKNLAKQIYKSTYKHLQKMQREVE